jgi:hypothetical protein
VARGGNVDAGELADETGELSSDTGELAVDAAGAAKAVVARLVVQPSVTAPANRSSVAAAARAAPHHCSVAALG